MILSFVVDGAVAGIVQLGFAICVASFLIWWLTSSMKKAIDANTIATINSQLMLIELIKIVMVHDAQIRGVNPTAGKDATEAHQVAAQVYQQTMLRIEHLEEVTTANLESLQLKR